MDDEQGYTQRQRSRKYTLISLLLSFLVANVEYSVLLTYNEPQGTWEVACYLVQ